jgi:hypothetical protein
MKMDKRGPMFSFAADPTGKDGPYPIEDWEAAVQQDRANVGLRMNLCWLLAARGRYERAIEHCEDCLANQVNNNPLSTSRRLRIVVMAVRLRRAQAKIGGRGSDNRSIGSGLLW